MEPGSKFIQIVPNKINCRRLNLGILQLGIIFLIIISAHLNVDAYPNGAPITTETCETMTPGHGVEPQDSLLHYIIQLDKKDVKPGERIKVSLLAPETSSPPFRGFLAIGKWSDRGTDNTPKGRFIGEIKSDENAPNLGKLGDCPNTQGTAMTHTSNVDKREIHLEWEAPMQSGKFVILVTFVANQQTFWVQNPSEIINVEGSGDGSTIPTTSTTTKPPSPGIGGNVQDFYKGCGDANTKVPKGCFGFPANCIGSKNCELFVTFRINSDKEAVFELAGKTGSKTSKEFVAVGLSRDSVMSDDSVLGCHMDGNSNTIAVGEYYNVPEKGGCLGITRPESTIKTYAGSYVDGYLACSFTLNATYSVPGYDQTYDVSSDEYFLLLARGTNSDKGYLTQHPQSTDREVSSESVKLSSVATVKAKSKILIELHGALMVMAWLFCASTGMFTARYYKQTHTEANPLGMAFWFQLHRSCMTLTLVFTIAAFVLIFVEIKGITSSSGGGTAEKVHPILGIILTGLALCQVGLALFRPHPGAKHRVAFNWIHWTIGNSAHIIGIACIYLAKDLSKSNIKGESKYWGVLTAFVCYHVFLHLLMTYYTVLTDKKMGVQNTKRAVSVGPMRPSGFADEAPGTDIRTIILVMYMAGALITASALIYFIHDSLKA